MQFALSSTSSWARNFRDLNGAVVRMAPLAQGVRISTEIVEEETQRLSASWSSLERGAEFEDSLKVTGKTAERQLRRQPRPAISRENPPLQSWHRTLLTMPLHRHVVIGSNHRPSGPTRTQTRFQFEVSALIPGRVRTVRSKLRIVYNILRQLGASRRIERQRHKFFKSRRLGSKS